MRVAIGQPVLVVKDRNRYSQRVEGGDDVAALFIRAHLADGFSQRLDGIHSSHRVLVTYGAILARYC